MIGYFQRYLCISMYKCLDISVCVYNAGQLTLISEPGDFKS